MFLPKGSPLELFANTSGFECTSWTELRELAEPLYLRQEIEFVKMCEYFTINFMQN